MRQPETRPSLIIKLTDQRNELAWAEFLCAYEPFLIQLVRRRGTPERHVSDVTQQLLMAIAKTVEGWKPDGREASFRRWLSRVARNVALKYLIRERRQISGQGGTEFLQQMEREPDLADHERQDGQYEHELIVWAAEQVRGEFRESSWKAFWATQVEGKSVADAAAEIGVSAGSIYMSRSRIFARIREKIDEVL
ncbi:MAG: sigma-70 family RNA polymerase sigma factor [Planctomycetota bacterium]